MFGGQSAGSAMVSSHSILEMRKSGYKGLSHFFKVTRWAQHQSQEAK